MHAYLGLLLASITRLGHMRGHLPIPFIWGIIMRRWDFKRWEKG